MYHLDIKWFKYTHGYILNSKFFPTIPYTPKSELKRRSYGPDKLDKENYVVTEKLCRDKVLCCNREIDQVFYCNRANSIVTKFSLATKKLCRDQVFYCNIANFVATKKTLSQQKNCVATEKTMSQQKR